MGYSYQRTHRIMHEEDMPLVYIWEQESLPHRQFHRTHSTLQTNFFLMISQGIGGWGGGLAEYIAVDTQHIHILPDSIPCKSWRRHTPSYRLNQVPVDIGACVEPLAVAWYAIKRSGFTKGQTALVLGSGPVSYVPSY